MKSIIITVTAIAFVVSSTTVLAGPDNFRRGLPARVADLEAQTQTNAENISTNSANIGTNTTNIANNGAAIASNSSGVSANAAGILANAAAIAAIPAQTEYDYRNYSTDATITRKVFSFTNPSSSCDTETQNFARATSGDTTTITRTRVRTSAGNPCSYQEHTMQATPTGFYMLSESAYNSDGTTLNQTVTLDNPVLLRSVNMNLGMSIADAATSTVTGPSATVPIGIYIEKTTLAAIESVTVPYNGGTTYNDCLKLHISRVASTGFGSGELNRVSWYCAGVGFVKRMQVRGTTSVVWELTDIVYAP